MYEIRHCGDDPLLPEHVWGVFESASGMYVSIHDPLNNVCTPLHMQKQDAERMRDQLNDTITLAMKRLS